MEICPDGKFFKNRMTQFIREEEIARRRQAAKPHRAQTDIHHPNLCRLVLTSQGRNFLTGFLNSC